MKIEPDRYEFECSCKGCGNETNWWSDGPIEPEDFSCRECGFADGSVIRGEVELFSEAPLRGDLPEGSDLSQALSKASGKVVIASWEGYEFDRIEEGQYIFRLDGPPLRIHVNYVRERWDDLDSEDEVDEDGGNRVAVEEA